MSRINLVSEKQLELTNQFIKEFIEMSDAPNDSYVFNYLIGDAISQSDIAVREKDEQHTILLGMSCIDDTIVKGMFHNRIQGFVKIIEDRLLNTDEQDNRRVDNIKTKKYKKDSKNIKVTRVNGKNDISWVESKIDAETTTFDVSCSSSGFSGNVVMFKEMQKHFINDNDFVEEMTTKKIMFYVNKTHIMSINYKWDYDNKKMYEEGEFTHYKHISDINSFYQTIKFQ